MLRLIPCSSEGSTCPAIPHSTRIHVPSICSPLPMVGPKISPEDYNFMHRTIRDCCVWIAIVFDLGPISLCRLRRCNSTSIVSRLIPPAQRYSPQYGGGRLRSKLCIAEGSAGDVEDR